MSVDFIKQLTAMRSISKVEDLIEDTLSSGPGLRFVTWFLTYVSCDHTRTKGCKT